MRPQPITDAVKDGRLIVGFRRVGRLQPHWDGHTMFWERGILRKQWIYTGLLRGAVPEGCEPTHYLPVED